ncbi:hypothetical protein EFN63_08105 [Leuconostoc citreum]|uniref:Peptidase C39-like domain-containing protein n=1 Tax=Leuconostoc citreum TaxID=33964 RepID=A0A5A5U1C2_LEUCI|nr:hypothetical protein [Leuconostoc citreum]MCT3068314.1 hypothetical protein [Leuconostoc citreum]OSP82556.1 hypothetical protein B9J75_03635 [Leuconostoc citreum]TDG65404.1 hypothetical protein C5L21_000607 [Leuconostoc citreum]UVW15872.1 hypothetical protein NX813_05490 [Leuconostoc citreum]GDZ84757.1 hypothetical protein LCIT_19990 [Leuconostoc citreum]
MKIAKQVGPLCGLYSLYNGLAYLNGLDKVKVDRNVLSALYSFTSSKAKAGYTEIGEYFDIDNYLSFIKNCNVNNIPFTVNFTAEKVILDSGLSQVENNDNCFIIVPTNPKKTSKNKSPKQRQDVLDWITVYKTKFGLFMVLNPITYPKFGTRGLKTKNGIDKQNKNLKDKYFTWKQYKHTSTEKARDGHDHTGIKKDIREKVQENWDCKKNMLLTNPIKIDYNKNVDQCIIIKRK